MSDNPEWIKTIAPSETENEKSISQQLERYDLHTVCQEADCPNQGECWRDGTATFLLLGDVCTRNCKFCDVQTGNPQGEIDENEPVNIAKASDNLNLDYVVLTSVDRDDLPDYGAGHFKQTINELYALETPPLVEALIPDFSCESELLELITHTDVDVIGHNIETVERLSPRVRDKRASYTTSLEVLEFIKQASPEVITKSSIMVGLGETRQEIVRVMKDLQRISVDIVTIGQYLRPSQEQLPVERFLNLNEFEDLKQIGLNLGFSAVLSGPFVRSSYKAKETYRAAKKCS